MEANRGPLARSQDLIIEELGDEVLVYDSNAERGHCLSADVARIWRRCDGRTPIEGLTAQVDMDAERVERALDELERCELLEERPTPTGHTRRELTVKFAKVSAAVAATPLIVSVAAPTPAMAATPAFCAKFSSGNCGGNTGCSSDVGCCCCTPPIQRPFPAGEPCSVFEKDPNQQQCKTCVPCDQQNLCAVHGHGRNSKCSAGDCPAV